MRFTGLLAAAAGLSLLVTAQAEAQGELNLYSSRHYDTDERLYTQFEEQTGIKINRIEDKADALIERMKAEGANSPADILLTVDAGRLWRADNAGLLQSVQSDVLDSRIPGWLRHPDGKWYGFSQRIRILFYDKNKVSPADIQTYASLADPKMKGMVCTRSSGNIYMLSLMAAMIEHKGVDGATEWAEGMWNNRARDPAGGDTDQLRGIASGECAVSVSNTYYFARALRKDVKGLPADKMANIGWVFPNQETTGAHSNISGAGIATHAPNKENAIKFLEYLASDAAQEYFSAGNDEYPAVMGEGLSPSVAQLGIFRSDTLNLAALGKNQAEAQRIYDRIGYK
jgi:iron(III) transport system substrate-binding protein